MKKLAALLMALVMVLSVCSFASAEEPFVITVTVAFYTEDQPDDENNPIVKYIEEALNVDFQFKWVSSGSAAETFNYDMASTEQPMIYVISSGVTSNVNYIDMCQEGAFWDLTDYIQASDLFREELTTPSCLAASSVDGRNYLFPLITSGARLGLLHRQDWLEKLGLEEPTTIETFKAMVEAFATQDPDGNGINDTIGFAYCDDADEEIDYAGFNTIVAWLGGPVNWGLQDGKLMPYFFFDEYFEALDLFKWMYENGYMNSDFAINTNKHAPVANNVSGSMFTSATAVLSNDYDNLNNIVGAGNWTLETQQELYKADGTRVMSSTVTAGSLGGILIPKYSVKTEEELQKILDVFTAIRTEGELDKVLTIGIEGIHYTVENGEIVVTDEQSTLLATDALPIASIVPRRIVSKDYGAPLTEKAKLNKQVMEKNTENEQYATVDLSMGYMDTDTRNLQLSIATIISDARVQYMMGKIDKDGFIAARDNWLAQGGQEIIDSVNAAYAEANK